MFAGYCATLPGISDFGQTPADIFDGLMGDIEDNFGAAAALAFMDGFKDGYTEQGGQWEDVE